MNPSTHAVFGLVMQVLREDVKPELHSDHAHTQLAGVLDILEKLERLLVPSPDLLRQKLMILHRASAEAGGTFAPPESIGQATLVQAVRDGESELRRLTDVAFDTESAVLHTHVQATLRKLLQVERSAVPRADFGAMTSGGKTQEPGNGDR